jgi:hypothetical protein
LVCGDFLFLVRNSGKYHAIIAQDSSPEIVHSSSIERKKLSSANLEEISGDRVIHVVLLGEIGGAPFGSILVIPLGIGNFSFLLVHQEHVAMQSC